MCAWNSLFNMYMHACGVCKMFHWNFRKRLLKKRKKKFVGVEKRWGALSGVHCDSRAGKLYFGQRIYYSDKWTIFLYKFQTNTVYNSVSRHLVSPRIPRGLWACKHLMTSHAWSNCRLRLKKTCPVHVFAPN